MAAKPQKIRVTFTVDEAKAVFSECNCCAPREHHEAATDKVYKALVRAGVYGKSRG